MDHRLRVHLSQQDRQEVQELLRGGLQAVRVVLRALALWQLAAGQTAAQVGSNLDLTPKAVRQIGGRYQSRERQAGAESGARNNPSLAPGPRVKTVAGKKCRARPIWIAVHREKRRGSGALRKAL